MRLEHPVDEARFAVEDVDRRIGDLAVHLQHQARFGHGLERRPDAARSSVTPASECVVAPAG